MTGTSPILEARGVTKTFGSLVAVDDVDVAIQEGEILGLIGPNGSGKTTLVNVITGELSADSGSVYLEETDITNAPQNEICNHGLIKTHQETRPLKNMTIQENITVASLYGNKKGFSTPEAKQDAEDWIKFVGIEEFADDKPSGLTHSTLRKVELARALATRPTVLMLDEVAAGLAKDEIQSFMKLVDEISNDLGITILWIEHIVEAVMGSSDRIMVLNHGQKIAEGTPQEVANNPEVQRAYLGGGE